MKYHSIIGATLLAIWSGCGFAAQIDAGPPSVLVTVTTMREGSLAHTINAYGAVLSLPSARRTITSQTSETVGDVHVRQGDEVAAGAPLLQLTPSPQMAATYAQAVSALREAEQLLARTHELFKQHLATAQQLANARKSESDARATLKALKAQGVGGSRTLRAPFRAIVSRVLTSPGALVSSGTPLVDLVKPDDLTLRVGVTPTEARRVDPGDSVRITTLGGGQTMTGTVSRRGSAIDPATGLVSVDITLPPNTLFPGETAEAVITVGQTQGYVVPHAAILVDQHGNPYVVQADGRKARKVSVHVVGTHGDKDAIRGAGLNAGQPLVLAGNYQLDDGMAIRFANDRKGAGK